LETYKLSVFRGRRGFVVNLERLKYGVIAESEAFIFSEDL